MRNVHVAWVVLILVALGALVGCSETLAAPSSTSVSSRVPSPVALSLRTSDWETISAPAMFPLKNDASGRLVFDFPVDGSMNYLYHVSPPKEISGIVSVSLQVMTTGPVVFNYRTEPFNTCTTPASVRPFIWANSNGNAEFDRWWSNPIRQPLAAGVRDADGPARPR